MSLFLRTTLLFSLVFLFTACSSVNFNDRYVDVKWNSIIVAPLIDDEHKYVTEQFVHEFSTNGTIRIITPERVTNKLKENADKYSYASDPIDTLNSLAQETGADGFLYTEVSSDGGSLNGRNGPTTTIRTTLFSSPSLEIVASTHEVHSSLFLSESYTLRASTEDTVNELREVFKRLNSQF